MRQRVNARSTFLCYKHAAKQMIAQGRGGRIIGAKISYPSPWHYVRQQANKVVSYGLNM
jgi:predicted dehydrogenase